MTKPRARQRPEAEEGEVAEEEAWVAEAELAAMVAAAEEVDIMAEEGKASHKAVYRKRNTRQNPSTLDRRRQISDSHCCVATAAFLVMAADTVAEILALTASGPNRRAVLAVESLSNKQVWAWGSRSSQPDRRPRNSRMRTRHWPKFSGYNGR